MGMTKRQLLWKVELPLALPEIIAGVRIATVSTVAIATLAIFAGAGGLGRDPLQRGHPARACSRRTSSSAASSRSRWRSSSTACSCSSSATPRRGGRSGRYERGPLLTLPAFLGSFGGAIDFIFNEQPSVQARRPVGGLGPDLGPARDPGRRSASSRCCSRSRSRCRSGSGSAIAASASSRAVAVGNAGRAIPELALIALMVAFIGTGVLNVTIAVTILGIPPILTNAFVGIRQVDRGAVDAARGMGMTELEIIRRVELPLAIPTIMGGVRTASVNIIATSTIGSLAGVKTLGDLILGPNVYGTEGVIAGAIVVALLALTFELILAGVQRPLTPRGLDASAAAARASA